MINFFIFLAAVYCIIEVIMLIKEILKHNRNLKNINNYKSQVDTTNVLKFRLRGSVRLFNGRFITKEELDMRRQELPKLP